MHYETLLILLFALLILMFAVMMFRGRRAPRVNAQIAENQAKSIVLQERGVVAAERQAAALESIAAQMTASKADKAR
ncbi:hypothetical protein [Celeribacter sp. SCSIO 80788]|uniref:hypothetical protein n=1 Tax=Celeribacter sp. SCSIO 80788 TaxID=3117013 RepID=UPI003DA42CA3